MNVVKPDSNMSANLAAQKSSIERRLGELREVLNGANGAEALAGYQALHAEVDGCVGKIKRRLLGTALAWTEEEKEASGWIYFTSHRMAKLGQRLVGALALPSGVPVDRRLDVAALALHYLGESVKCEVNVGRQDPYDFRGTHSLMKMALATGRQGDERRFVFDGRAVVCSIEALYFRALLLARFSTGNLNAKQIEIFDACLWLWMPALRPVREAPEGSALRADLDSSDGLRRGPRPADEDLSLYLPQGPIEEAYQAIVKEFHAGRIVPAEGFTSEFRIEEHVAVLNVVRQGLLDSRAVPAPRAERHAAGFEAEAFVGLTEIMARGFEMAVPDALSYAAKIPDAAFAAPVANKNPMNNIYEPVRRRIQWVDVSETGLGASWKPGDCGEICVGDLVGIRRSVGDTLIVGRVVRSVPAPDGTRTEIGVSIITKAARPVKVTRPTAGKGDATLDLLYVPGADGSGRHDAYLVPERLYRDAAPFETEVGGNAYGFRFNRMRERGHGWALAGFEVTGMHRAEVAPEAAAVAAS